ncbi:D-alanine--D-alanine ligase family protein [Egicoccus halophilus]|uniref:D-alanine--D-alanine ligase n=1 Tax=Egicoccus halophilus TaxID=1670830 RepID=A0A8J3AAF9_9ACTN|nr:D-alanine--D-alanine ligase family protein [Egicoccus halophilus]GGI06422.1 D-alanine--D-alanine ligase [Egicoccus halophilus]
MKRVLLLFGGRSSEHEVSCLSARSVLAAVDRERYEIVPVGITRDGRWTLTDGVVQPAAGRALPEVADAGPTVALVGGADGARLVEVDERDDTARVLGRIDVAFPVLHGPWGEDGTVQGLLATVGVPYVGADVTASSIGVDKGAMKAAFAARGLPQGPYVSVHRRRWSADPQLVAASLEDQLAYPWFVKPARQGSSIGIGRVADRDGLAAAFEEAYRYDDVAIVEQGFAAPRELEVGVLGNEELAVTAPGEIRPSHEFYDFEAKYLDESELVVPAEVPADVAERIDHLAREAYRAIGCAGMARVDFFLTDAGELLVNEINTIPGFTPNSMFPRLWDAQDLAYPQLVDRLLDLALERG